MTAPHPVELRAKHTLKRTTVAARVAVVIAMVTLVVALGINFKNDADVRGTFGPCLGNFESVACQLYREQSARSGSNHVACIFYRRATGTVGDHCNNPITLVRP